MCKKRLRISGKDLSRAKKEFIENGATGGLLISANETYKWVASKRQFVKQKN